MPHLSVRLFGPLEVTLDGEVVTGFKSDKARALLAYLVVEAQRPHRREKLAGLLWPEWPEQAARGNLRRVLSNLRLAIGNHKATLPFLHISRQTIQFNSASDAWVDVTAFTGLLETRGDLQQLIGQLEEAVELYRGDFLEGFSIPDSAAFEEWALLNRERFHRLVIVALHRLARCYEQRGEYDSALRHAWRQVELEPWQEEGHQQVMRLLALSGQRGAALAQYETCRRLLAEELGVEPAEETTRLYEQIRDGLLSRRAEEPFDFAQDRRRGRGLVAAAAVTPPAFLTSEPLHPSTPAPCVARERELAQLAGFLDLALAGQGRVVFVTGEAGSGKTALIQEFTQRAQEAHADLIVTSGNCNAHTGVGDPYLPFREILELLTGDVEARWAAGTITREHARRLWDTLPLAAQALMEAGPDLIDTFVPCAALMERAVAHAPSEADWLTRLDELVERKATGPGAPSPQQSDLFGQYTRVLKALARQGPLLLVLDDLQWADSGSISLLFHLGRQLAGSRILIVGAYRPEEVALRREGERHPLEPVVNEFQREFGDIMVNVDQAEGREFVEAFLDSEPNRLGLPFREMLYQQTRGHPLFTIELLRGMQEREDLVQDQEGRWVEEPALDWETLPARVEAVIAERVGRLPEPLQETLRVASVEGEVFTAEAVAQVQAADEREIIHHLSGELSRQHRLVAAQSFQRGGSQCLSRYRFRHFLFQKYLYSHLDPVERAHLHEAMGNLLEALYRERVAAGALELGAQFPPVAEGAVQLARHFQAAGIPNKAAEYRLHAGIRAHLLSAGEEAVAHFNQGLALLETLPDSPKRAEQELTLQNALANALKSFRASTDPEVVRVYARIQELCEQMPEVPLLLLNGALWMLNTFHLWRAEYEKALEVGKQILALAPRAEDPLFIATAHVSLGWVLPYLGEFASARDHLEHMIDFCDRQPQRSLWFVDWENLVTALTYQSWALWFLGYPDQASERSTAATALAQKLDHVWTLAYASSIAGAAFHLFRRESQAAQKHVEAVVRVSAKAGLAVYQAEGMCYRGWRQILVGQVDEGIAQLRQCLDTMQAVGTVRHRTSFLAALAEGYAKVGQPEQGLGVLAAAFSLVAQTGERYYLAELHRLKGELLLMQRDEAEAENSFHQAIEVARRQQAKSWELRVAMSLCRLWQEQGKREEARQLLAETYGWFSEGFDTPDLKEAKALLEELS
jgi:DNA-binding SARP family transcriptional activator/predicted ATPase